MERENGNAENLIFQIKRLQSEGVKVDGCIRQLAENALWENSEKRLSPERPRWKIIDQDKGIIFARKGSKHMDILEGEDEERGIKYRDIIIYDSTFQKDTLVRTKKEPLNGENK